MQKRPELAHEQVEEGLIRLSGSFGSYTGPGVFGLQSVVAGVRQMGVQESPGWHWSAMVCVCERSRRLQ